MVCWKIIKLFEKKLKRKLSKEEKKEIQNILHAEEIEYEEHEADAEENKKIPEITA